MAYDHSIAWGKGLEGLNYYNITQDGGGALRNPKTKVSEYVIHGHWTAPTVLFSENEVISRNIK